jgi:hypothetical protein
MIDAKDIGSRSAALVLLFAGVLILVLSFQTWASCPTSPCGGIFMAISEYSGLDLGFGVVIAIAGLLLAAIGLDALRGNGVSRFARAAVPLAFLIVVTVGASVVWMYVIPGDDKDYRPRFAAILVAFVSLVSFAAGLRLRPPNKRRST